MNLESGFRDSSTLLRRDPMSAPRILQVSAVLLALLALPCVAGEPGDNQGKDEREIEKEMKAGDRDPAFLMKVTAAVQKGMEWLLSKQREDGSFPDGSEGEYVGGATAIALLALLKSGVTPQDPNIEKGFAYLHTQPLQKTYAVALTLMALEARWSPHKVEDAIKGHTVVAGPGKLKVPPQDLDWMKELTVFLAESMVYSKQTSQNGTIISPKNAWSYPKGESGDHSNTQYAILGLRSAQHCGVAVPRELWEDIWTKVADHFLDVQEKEGPKVQRVQMLEDKKHGYVSYKTGTSTPDTARGWTYSSGLDAKAGGTTHSDCTTGSMTSVGVASLMIALEGLTNIGSTKAASRRPEITKAVFDGLAWLTLNFKVDSNPGHPTGTWLHYYLYGMERACILAGARNLGQHDWYREGADWLVENQDGSGSWSRKSHCGVLPDTCFALLFLTKATVPGRVQITR
jgi:hypothetical protein